MVRKMLRVCRSVFIYLLPDKLYLKIRYRYRLGRGLNLKNPETFNEKLQWLKLYDRNPMYTKLVDKYEVKKYVADLIGEEYIIPTLGVWDHFEDIDFNILPNQFVLKCTHDSGSQVIVKNKDKLDKKAVKKKLERCLKHNYYYGGREWPYKNVRPRIIAEKYMTDESGTELKDYKIFNFNGEPKMIQVDYNRFIDHKRNLYSVNWDLINASILYKSDESQRFEKPKQLEKMLEFARLLSDCKTFVRTDFYSIEEQIYFGEITFYPGSGIEKVEPEEFNKIMGEWLKLPKNEAAF